MFRTLRRALVSTFVAGALLFGGTAIAASEPHPYYETQVAAVGAAELGAIAVSRGGAPDAFLIATLMAFAFGWVVVELRRV